MVEKLTEQQIAEYKDAFAIFDVNNDGSISKSELKNLLVKLNKTPTEDELNKMLEVFDTDNTGAIYFAEFLSVMANRTHQEDDMIEIFKQFDKDGNGFITTHELKQAMAKMGECMTDGEAANMIKEADLDNDGQVNYTEFARMLCQQSGSN